MRNLTRRQLMQGAAAFGMTALLDATPAQAGNTHFRFVHFTDLHIQPELGASDGVRLAVKKLLSLRPRPDFIITGGDHVMDWLKVSRERADVQFALLQEAFEAAGNANSCGRRQPRFVRLGEGKPRVGKRSGLRQADVRRAHSQSARVPFVRSWRLALRNSGQFTAHAGTRLDCGDRRCPAPMAKIRPRKSRHETPGDSRYARPDNDSFQSVHARDDRCHACRPDCPQRQRGTGYFQSV